MTLDQITQLPNGARFHRCDLHIHSFGGSHDVSDGTMTPEAIVETASAEGLSMIAVTDHNEITNVERAVEAGLKKGVVVVAGVELSTPEGHLLCYTPDVATLKQLHGRLKFADSGKANSDATTVFWIACRSVTHWAVSAFLPTLTAIRATSMRCLVPDRIRWTSSVIRGFLEWS